MKVFIVLVILCIAAVLASPVEEKNEVVKPDSTNIELDPADFDIEPVNDELTRDKRQFGYGGYGGGYGGYGGGYGGLSIDFISNILI